jgi:hypothetical protein
MLTSYRVSYLAPAQTYAHLDAEDYWRDREFENGQGEKVEDDGGPVGTKRAQQTKQQRQQTHAQRRQVAISSALSLSSSQRLVPQVCSSRYILPILINFGQIATFFSKSNPAQFISQSAHMARLLSMIHSPYSSLSLNYIDAMCSSSQLGLPSSPLPLTNFLTTPLANPPQVLDTIYTYRSLLRKIYNVDKTKGGDDAMVERKHHVQHLEQWINNDGFDFRQSNLVNLLQYVLYEDVASFYDIINTILRWKRLEQDQCQNRVVDCDQEDRDDDEYGFDFEGVLNMAHLATKSLEMSKVFSPSVRLGDDDRPQFNQFPNGHQTTPPTPQPLLNLQSITDSLGNTLIHQLVLYHSTLPLHSQPTRTTNSTIHSKNPDYDRMKKTKETNPPKSPQSQLPPSKQSISLSTQEYDILITVQKSILLLVQEFKIDINTKNCFGFTPLHLACLHLNIPLIKTILFLGGDVTIKDNWNRTIVMLLVQNMWLEHNYHVHSHFYLEFIHQQQSPPDGVGGTIGQSTSISDSETGQMSILTTGLSTDPAFDRGTVANRSDYFKQHIRDVPKSVANFLPKPSNIVGRSGLITQPHPSEIRFDESTLLQYGARIHMVQNNGLLEIRDQSTSTPTSGWTYSDHLQQPQQSQLSWNHTYAGFPLPTTIINPRFNGVTSGQVNPMPMPNLSKSRPSHQHPQQEPYSIKSALQYRFIRNSLISELYQKLMLYNDQYNSISPFDLDATHHDQPPRSQPPPAQASPDKYNTIIDYLIATKPRTGNSSSTDGSKTGLSRGQKFRKRFQLLLIQQYVDFIYQLDFNCVDAVIEKNNAGAVTMADGMAFFGNLDQPRGDSVQTGIEAADRGDIVGNRSGMAKEQAQKDAIMKEISSILNLSLREEQQERPNPSSTTQSSSKSSQYPLGTTPSHRETMSVQFIDMFDLLIIKLRTIFMYQIKAKIQHNQTKLQSQPVSPITNLMDANLSDDDQNHPTNPLMGLFEKDFLDDFFIELAYLCGSM